MKITKRMKKILLFLLHPENTYQWFDTSKQGILGIDYYWDQEIMVLCEKKLFGNFRYSEKVSYRRTFKILEKLGLVERGEYPSHYKLTDKGRKIAKRIENEIRDLVKEYSHLVSWKNFEL